MPFLGLVVDDFVGFGLADDEALVRGFGLDDLVVLGDAVLGVVLAALLVGFGLRDAVLAGVGIFDGFAVGEPLAEVTGSGEGLVIGSLDSLLARLLRVLSSRPTNKPMVTAARRVRTKVRTMRRKITSDQRPEAKTQQAFCFRKRSQTVQYACSTTDSSHLCPARCA